MSGIDDQLAGRMKEVVKAAGGPSRIARELQMPLRTVSRFANADGEPYFLTAARICALANASLDWLYTGNAGSGLNEKVQAAYEAPGVAHGAAQIDLIPVYDVRASAGHGSWNDRADIVMRIPFDQSFLRRLRIEPSRVHGIRCAGDSMEPTVMDGALVLVDTSRREIVGDGIWVLVVDDQARIKRAQLQLDGSLLLLSDNKQRYQPERLDKADLSTVEVVGRVFWTEKML